MNSQIKKLWVEWKNNAIEDPGLQQELELISDDEATITECFYRNLTFGTGGLRGIIGVGTNRMNIYTVAKATQGYSIYLRQHFTTPSVAIAYDSRIKSDLFAEVAAGVFAANGIQVYLYPELMPTPALSYAVRHLQCSGGIVITASHNPAKYNGYKVYGADGCQITNDAATAILQAINTVDIFTGVKKFAFQDGMAQGLISYIDDSLVQAYIDAVSSQALCNNESINKDISIIYTPLNGAGLTCVTRCLQQNGFTNVLVVAEQEHPDGSFPTCPFPNPEIREALQLGLRDAKRLNSDLLLATDPDCDRIGIAVKSNDEYVLLTGNEVGILMLDYICKRRIALSKMPSNPILVKTLVTTDMAKLIAQDYGVKVIDVLTGFKYIGEQIGRLEQCGEEDSYILGFEESYGYLTGSYVRDKDAVNGALIICEMFAYYQSQGLGLLEVLDELYLKYGYCYNNLHSYEFEGSQGFDQMQKIMTTFRNYSPNNWLGYKILAISDYQQSVTYYADGSEVKILLPQADVLKYELESNISLVVRPSGTEPKLKIYLSVCADGRAAAQDLEQRLISEIEQLLDV